MLITLPNAYGDAATNMAVDASLLESLPRKTAVFRHYGWVEPAMTFGYAQALATAQGLAPPDMVLCRRITGGGIVDHRNDWTYALIIESSLRAARIAATELYERVHRALAQAAQDQDVDTQLAPCPRQCDSPLPPKITGVCFTEPAANDVLLADGRKLAGAAMKRNRKGLLLQGSVDRSALPEDFDYTAFQLEFVANLAASLGLEQAQPEDLRHLFDGAAIQKERSRFKDPDWTGKR
ncbi:lipoyl protein ligase domain-containing protein [Coraliomargarita parva]|uniref:lipoyl protein ligase domain-containing protein n=1 Tax=Coraliomargarita parva TaxID=3014050 RepID=UPI0022B4F6EA|nr:hypothetical protein [Coraliomargarita parva]